MVKERSGLRAGPVWTETCIFCHNTPTYLSTVLGALAGPGSKPYQGEVVDPLHAARSARRMDRDRCREALVRARGRARAHWREAKVSHGGAGHLRDAQLVSSRAPRRARHRLRGLPSRLREHVADPRRLPSFEPRKRLLRREMAGPPRRKALCSYAPCASTASARAVIRCSSPVTSRPGRAAAVTATPAAATSTPARHAT